MNEVRFFERVVETVLEDIGVTPSFDVSIEFSKYLFLIGLLEDILGIYGNYLIDKSTNKMIELIRVLSDIFPQRYLVILQILLNYPDEMYSTLTAGGSTGKMPLTML